jgi:hypothetical protein
MSLIFSRSAQQTHKYPDRSPKEKDGGMFSVTATGVHISGEHPIAMTNKRDFY